MQPAHWQASSCAGDISGVDFIIRWDFPNFWQKTQEKEILDLFDGREKMGKMLYSYADGEFLGLDVPSEMRIIYGAHSPSNHTMLVRHEKKVLAFRNLTCTRFQRLDECQDFSNAKTSPRDSLYVMAVTNSLTHAKTSFQLATVSISTMGQRGNGAWQVP